MSDMTDDLEWAARIEPKTGERVGYLWFVGTQIWQGGGSSTVGMKRGDVIRIGRTFVLQQGDVYGNSDYQTQTQA